MTDSERGGGGGIGGGVGRLVKLGGRGVGMPRTGVQESAVSRRDEGRCGVCLRRTSRDKQLSQHARSNSELDGEGGRQWISIKVGRQTTRAR